MNPTLNELLAAYALPPAVESNEPESLRDDDRSMYQASRDLINGGPKSTKPTSRRRSAITTLGQRPGHSAPQRSLQGLTNRRPRGTMRD